MRLFYSLIISILYLKLICLNNNGSFGFEFRVSEIHKLIRTNEWTCSDVVEYFHKRASVYNRVLNAIINYNSNAFSEAIKLDDFYQTNKTFKGKLHCIPIIVKDNTDVEALPSTGGINALRRSIPNIDAKVVSLLRAQGAIVIAKTNLAELAEGSENSETGGLCKNPYDLRRSCGGSSTGVGAGIASGMGIIGIGTDTDGSILIPSSFNGVFGFRTPQDKLPLDGIIPLFERQDVVGPMAKHIDDLVLAYSIMDQNPSIYDNFQKPISANKLKLGVFKNFIEDFVLNDPVSLLDVVHVVNDDIRKQFNLAINRFKKLNVAVKELRLDDDTFKGLFATGAAMYFSSEYCILYCRKDSMDKYLNNKDRFSFDAPYKNFKSMVESPLLSKFWKDMFDKYNVVNPPQSCSDTCSQYDKHKANFRNLINQLFVTYDFDVIMIPTLVILPFISSNPNITSTISDKSISSYTGLPSLNLPIGFTDPTSAEPDGLPVGSLLITRSESLLETFKIAEYYEKNYPTTKLPHTTPLINKCD